MKPVRARPARALEHLRAADPKLATLIDAVGPCRFRARAEGTHFDAVVRSIIYQQISGKAAATIVGRLQDLYRGQPPSAAQLLGTSEERLRSAGLSRQKQAYLRDLAEKTKAGRIDFANLNRLPDDEVIAQLTSVKGVGVWTAQIFLMFRLGRADVLPAADLGIQKAIQRAYRLRALPTPAKVTQIGRIWAPHRTIAAWYLWRSLDGDASV